MPVPALIGNIESVDKVKIYISIISSIAKGKDSSLKTLWFKPQSVKSITH